MRNLTYSILLLALTAAAGAQTAPAPTPAPQAAPAAPSRLALADAEQLALRNHPRITVAQLEALAARQVVREVRSNLLPTLTTNLTGVDSEENSRIAAGGLNNPIIYERAAAGVTASQLITDFGRTSNLTA